MLGAAVDAGSMLPAPHCTIRTSFSSRISQPQWQRSTTLVWDERLREREASPAEQSNDFPPSAKAAPKTEPARWSRGQYSSLRSLHCLLLWLVGSQVLTLDELGAVGPMQEVLLERVLAVAVWPDRTDRSLIYRGDLAGGSGSVVLFSHCWGLKGGFGSQEVVMVVLFLVLAELSGTRLRWCLANRGFASLVQPSPSVFSTGNAL